MTLFFEGTLQEGIALAMRDAKAVVCFVRDDAELSTTWEQDYFADEEIAQVLRTKAVVLRLTAGSQEAGFLTSFCPIAKFPTVTVIMNGTLQEYIVPEVSKDDFRTRLSAAVNGQKSPGSTQESQRGPAAASNDTAAASTVSGPTPAAASTPSQPRTTPSASGSTRPSQSTPQEKSRVTTPAATKESPNKPAPSRPQPAKEVKKENLSPRPEKKQATPKKATVSADEEPEPKKPAPRGPPSQYRLQVRLFDGSSVRSSFSPSQTITKDVRPWLDGQMGDEKRPYHLKHILTPLPNRTLSVADESQTLQNLGLGSTANLVMIPVQAYTEAYASAGSLPARGASAVYKLVSSIVGTAVGFVGSLIGYGPSAPTSETDSSAPSSAPAPAESSRQPRPTGPNIRTLRDQERDRGTSQLYNGNQLNFEPKDQDPKDK